MKIVMIDYGIGNVANVANAFKRLGTEVHLSKEITDIQDSDAIILPGVGAASDAMEHLRQYDLIDVLASAVQSGKPFLGICLGMQLLFDKSYEDGEHAGLGYISGEIIPFNTELKVPHMGWNDLQLTKPHPITANLGQDNYAYFVHSYLLDPKYSDSIIATTEYDGIVPTIVAADNVIGMQFHPEKSGPTGDQLLRNFIAFARKEA